MTAESNLALSVFTRDKADSERLAGLQGHEKLDCAYDGNVRIFAPLGQSCEDLIENCYARHNSCPGEMPGQAGMISVDRAANFKVQAAKFHSSHQIQQLGTERAICSSVSEPGSRTPLLLESERLGAFTRFANNVRGGESR